MDTYDLFMDLKKINEQNKRKRDEINKRKKDTYDRHIKTEKTNEKQCLDCLNEFCHENGFYEPYFNFCVVPNKFRLRTIYILYKQDEKHLLFTFNMIFKHEILQDNIKTTIIDCNKIEIIKRSYQKKKLKKIIIEEDGKCLKMLAIYVLNRLKEFKQNECKLDTIDDFKKLKQCDVYDWKSLVSKSLAIKDSNKKDLALKTYLRNYIENA